MNRRKFLEMFIAAAPIAAVVPVVPAPVFAGSIGTVGSAVLGASSIGIGGGMLIR